MAAKIVDVNDRFSEFLMGLNKDRHALSVAIIDYANKIANEIHLLKVKLDLNLSDHHGRVSIHSPYFPKEKRKRDVIDVDTLANIIRHVDGNHSLGAGALAEKIIEQLKFDSKGTQTTTRCRILRSFGLDIQASMYAMPQPQRRQWRLRLLRLSISKAHDKQNNSPLVTGAR